MSKYTTELRFICEQHCIDKYPNEYTEDNIDEKSVFDIASTVANDGYLTKYGDSDFIIFDEAYRVPLMRKFIMKYYTREIGLETFGLWKSKVRNYFDIIMPYYNELYKSTLLEYDPLNPDNYKEHNYGTRDSKEDSKDTTTNENTSNTISGTDTNGWILYSDTPQGGIYGIERAENPPLYPNLTENGYLTNATRNINNGSQNVSNNGNSSGVRVGDNKTLTTDNYIREVLGRRGYDVNKLLKSYRENILNIDEEIIGKFKQFFMLLW